MNRTTAFAATAAVLALAACSSSTHSNSTSASQSAAATPAAASTLPPGVSLSASSLPPGPFTITPLSCGPYTAAQQAQSGTSATGGLTYSYTSNSNTATGAPSLRVDFIQGTTVLGSNVTHALTPVGPGQTAQGTVDALTGNGGSLGGYTCELMGYSIGYSPTVAFAP